MFVMNASFGQRLDGGVLEPLEIRGACGDEDHSRTSSWLESLEIALREVWPRSEIAPLLEMMP